MIEKGKEYRISDETFDKIIKKGIEMEMDDGKDIITDSELVSMGYPLPPDDIPERIKKERRNNRSLRNRRPAFIRKFLIVAAALVILMATMSVAGVKVYVFDIVSEIKENSIQFFGRNENAYVYDAEESLAYENAEKESGFAILKPGYLPEGFVFEKVKIYPNDRVVMHYKMGDKTIKLTQKLLIEDTKTGEMVDINDGETYTIKARDTKITVGKHEQKETNTLWLSAVWYDEQLVYRVDANCTKEELEKFIKKLK